MPELPEVEVLVRDLRPRLLHQVLTKITLGSRCPWHLPAEFVRGFPYRIQSFERRGKWIAWSLEKDWTLWTHLGMTGQLRWTSSAASLEKHEHVVFCLKGAEEQLRFRDIRKFGELKVMRGAETPTRIAPDPFEMTSDAFASAAKKRKKPLKTLLLDQQFMSGAGNIYANEALFRAGLRPARLAIRVSIKDLTRLHQSLVQVLKESIERGGSSIDDYVHSDGGQGDYQKHHQVYGREGLACVQCSAAIRKVVLGGRSTFYCSHCQH